MCNIISAVKILYKITSKGWTVPYLPGHLVKLFKLPQKICPINHALLSLRKALRYPYLSSCAISTERDRNLIFTRIYSHGHSSSNYHWYSQWELDTGMKLFFCQIGTPNNQAIYFQNKKLSSEIDPVFKLVRIRVQISLPSRA